MFQFMRSVVSCKYWRISVASECSAHLIRNSPELQGLNRARLIEHKVHSVARRAKEES